MSDTITAIATPLGEGGIGVVRIGGGDALKIMRSVFKECPEDVVPRHAYFGHAVNSDGEIIDEYEGSGILYRGRYGRGAGSRKQRIST